MDIGSAIKSIRTRNKITQKDLAVKCGISANALCSIEKIIVSGKGNNALHKFQFRCEK
jgi:transcriptional regulator with XRE-family HTH domain